MTKRLYKQYVYHNKKGNIKVPFLPNQGDTKAE